MPSTGLQSWTQLNDDTRDYPVDEDGRRELMLRAAGFTPELLGAAARKAFDKLMSLMEAKRITPITHEGKVTETIETEDNITQLRAAQAILDLGYATYRAEEARNAGTHITIDLSGWGIRVEGKEDGKAHSWEEEGEEA